MDYKVLYRKHRPLDFDNVVGQDYIVKTLKNSISKGKNSHAYIFTGPRGTGKTSVAKIFAKAVNCLDNKEGNPCGKCESCLNIEANADIVEIDAASNNGVEEIRELINNIHLAPAYSKYKVYIIDEVHMLSGSAFNALLLTLEEPPPYVVFILATTEIQSVPVTVLSRCQRYDFRKISNECVIQRLQVITKEEKIKISKEALEEIAYICEGGMRDALSILEQLVEQDDKDITLDEVVSVFGTVAVKSIKELISFVEQNDASAIIKYLNEVSEMGINFRLFVGRLIEQLKEKAIKQKIGSSKETLSFDTIKKLIFELNDTQNNVKMSTNPYLLLELILLSYIDVKDEQNISREIFAQELTPVIEEKLEERPLVPQETQTEPDNELVKIRLNNCFAGARKEKLEQMKEIWETFLKDLKKLDKKLLSTLIDSTIVAASDTYAIIATKNESIAHLINDELSDISSLIKENYKEDYYFIALSEAQWIEEKTEYAQKRKNGQEYILIDEKKVIKTPKKKSEAESVAREIFGVKLEIK